MRKNRLLASKSPTPIYYQLRVIIQKDIEEGRLKPGARVSSERQLAKQYSLSLGTVRQAIGSLVNEGFLLRHQGKGTYVAGTVLRKGSLRYYRLRKSFRDAEEDLAIKLLSLKRISGRKFINEKLNIRENEELFELERVFYIGEKPTIYTLSYLSCRQFKSLDSLSQHRFEKMTFYETVENEYGIATINNTELISAIAASAAISKVLKVPKGQPILLVEMLSFTHRKRIYEYRLSYCSTVHRQLAREY